MANSAFDAIRAGDRITIVNRFGQEQAGRAVMYNRQYDSWVLNMGGAHGKTAIATRENVVKISPKKTKRNPVQNSQFSDVRKKVTSEEIARDYELWGEYFDPMATMSESDFNALTVKERKAMIDEVYPIENPAKTTKNSEARKSAVQNSQFSDVHILESFVDKYGVTGLLTAISEICEEKAQHIRENWQDNRLATTWDKDAKLVSAVAARVRN